MVDLWIKYTEPICSYGSYELMGTRCPYDEWADLDEECKHYERTNEKVIGDECKHRWHRICFYQGTLKRFSFAENEDIQIGRKCIPWDNICSMRIKEGRKTIYKMDEVEE